MRNYREFLAKKRAEYGEKFDASSLNPAFVKYFESGERVKVRIYSDDDERTGTIGVTTGWAPCFLLMRRSNALGSSDCIMPESRVVAVQHGRTYQRVSA